MSDNLEFDANNLCIAEDAFEQFQAVAMYQEPTYVTLATADPSKELASAPNEFCDLGFDNEVIVGTQVEINTILSECAEDPCVLEDQRLNNTSVADDNCEQDNISPPKNKKKSRKKNVSNDDSPLNSINCAIIGSKPSQDPEEKASSKRPKKTKSKSTLETPPEVSNTPLKALNTDPETNDNKRMRTRPKRLSSSNIQLYSMSYTSDSDHSDSHVAYRLTKSVKSTKSTKKSRSSRKKSLATNIETEVEQVDNPAKLTELCKTLELNPAKSKTGMKGKTNKINIIRDITLTENEDLDNMTLSQLKGHSRPSNTDENNISESNKTHNTTNIDKHAEVESPLQPYNKSTEKNKSRKRGRPKKDSDKTPEKPSSDVKSSNDTAQMTNENSTHTLNDVSETVHSTTACETVTEANPTFENNISEGCNASIDVIGASAKRNTKMPIMSDFEYNIDKVIDKESTENQNNANNNDNSLLVEDTSKRRARKKVPLLRYDEESDEDPFANIELSDDDEPRTRKGKRYYSDDEYVPGKREYKDINSTDSEAPELIDEAKAQRKKRIRSKKSDSQSPRKKINNDKQDTRQDDDVEDVEMVLQGSVVKEGENLQPSKIWGSSNEFENFLAKKIQGTNLKITKVSSTEPTETRTLEIPMIDQEARKTIEMCTQTNILKMVSTGMQTTPPHDVPMKENITLTAEQSEKACDFLSGIVKTTAELGTLMTQKSEDFIAKKINTANVNDTMKVDYCVKKSFLLFKLAKHNLMQMEEDLAKRYEEFLMSNNLTSCREQQKEIIPKPNEISSDSDCEIVETPVQASVGKREDKLKFNPKTVFLNKELSIKIAKKPTENKTLNIKGHHAIWISDTVMVKKIPPTQSFLAQDSRNKKPPDNKITTKMVSDFFKSYYRERVLSTCAPFVTTDWLNVNKECVCNYFVVKPHQFNNNVNYPENGGIGMNSTASNTRASARNNNFNNVKNTAKSNIVTSPETLFKMCYRKVRNQLHDHSHVQEVCQQMQNELTDGKKEPVTLLQLSLRALAEQGADIMGSSPPPSQTIPSDETTQSSALPLKTLCYHKVVDLLHDTSQNDSMGAHQSGETMLTTVALNGLLPTSPANYVSQANSFKNEIKTLLSLCVELIQKNKVHDTKIISIFVPKTLKTLTFKCVERLLYADFKQNLILSSQLSSSNCHYDDDITTPGLTINSVNTLSEEAFKNLEQSLVDAPDSSEYFDDFDHDDHYESEFIEAEDNNQEEPNWVSQVQLKELRSCVNTNIPDIIEEENVLLQTQIKLEPLDDTLGNVDGMACVKIEPTPGLDEMTMLPDIKPDFDEPARQNSSSYNIDEFEDFVTSNKLMSGLQGDDIFSQSALRVRRQHEPDYYEEVDTSMSLLIPQAYEPLSADNAKGSLMESSSDEDNSKNKKVTGKKKVDKRSKGKNKKLEQKPTSKEIPAQTKEKPSNIEVANLTKKMRDKINQEEKCDDSTDSENDDLPRRLRKRKEDSQAQTSTTKDSDIQCNNVDSTDKVEDDVGTFTGFTAIDQNEISTYQKYMKYVYDKIIPNNEPKPDRKENTAAIGTQDSNVGDIINPNEPVELLECEPTMPFFDDVIVEQKRNEVKSKIIADRPLITKSPASFVDRHGWHCYPVNPEDTKIYLNNYVVLEKLPESFVQTYFEYQGISLNKNDAEINRLTNLNSLSRKVKEPKSKKSKKDGSDGTGVIKSEPGSRSNSPSHSEHYDELEPSDDEGTRVEDEVAPPVAQRQTENALAKNLLMDDNNSDGDEPLIKKEPLDDDVKRPKRNSNSKKTVAELDGEDLMLTADKMMNKELNLLHAPVLPEEVKENTSKGPITRNKQKSATKNQPSGSKVKGEEDSSSEEEKQWVTTKEKLLKRLCKKEDQGLDDAKRAKLVNEFIERRADFPDSHQRSRHKSKRSSKKYLERQKQLRVLSRELFGEPDPSTSKRSQKAQASLLYKGRRNIRKVIDKKSLARSTVMANMEEFERKRRLNARQAALRERLGCEEGVNVLVINDEVCLEYDFEANRPIVTVHSFFTKVMKAHQYEGVKFMWDACFESLSELEAGRGGGGCILAHCMGLGKTLQVLALLHTVLTHPRVGIKRVLVVCPLSTVLNWVDEIHKWIGPVTNKIKVFELSKLKKTYERAYQLEDWYNGGGIFIIGYELFRSLSTLDPFLDDIRPTIINKIRTALLDPGPDIIVCDEGHLLKNDCSVLSVAMSRVVTKRRIILTGTPMQNNLREYYCMVNFVKPNLLGTYAEYSNRFENPIMNGQHRDSREEDIKLMKARTHILHKVLEGCLQRQEASVLYPYLPKKHEYTLFITQTKCQWELYKHYLTHYGNQTKQSILKDFHILQKIWSHPQVLHNFQTKAQDRRNKIKAEKLEDDLATEDLEEIKPNPTDLWWLEYLEGGNMLETLDSSNKFVVVFRILNECTALGDKVLIFSTSLFCLDAVEYFLKKINKWSLGQEYFRLDGSVPAEVRQKWCREFNADNNYKTKLFLVSTRAGCLGLNMTAANRVIIMDTSWNPAHDIQSIFRVYRFGQKKDCFIYRLVAMGTMEQKIYERSVTKQAVACRVVDEQQIDRHYNMADLTELYKFDELGSSVAGGVAVGVADVALLRVARLPALHAVHEHDSLLRDSSEQGLPEHERNAAWMQFQQEQTHKQIENKLVQEVPNTPMKRLHGHDYALSPIPPEIKTEDKSDDFQPSEPKQKKGKKIIKCCIPIQDNKKNVPDIKVEEPMPTTSRANKRPASPEPGTSKQDEKLEPEEVMVERITDILLKHNFQHKKGNSDIAKLVTKVRNLVSKGFIDKEDTADELTASIANILIPRRVSVPAATEIICESINNSAAPCFNTDNQAPDPPAKPGPASRKNKNVNTQPVMTTIKTETGIRTKRRAAIQAEKHIDSLVQDVVIDLDDEDTDSADVDFVPDVVEKPQNINKTQKKTSKNGSFLEDGDSDASGTLTASSLSPSKFDDSVPSYANSIKANSNTNNNKPSVDAIKFIKTKDQSPKPVANKDKPNQTTQKTNEKRKSPAVEAADCSIILSDDEEPEPQSKSQKKVEKEEEPKTLSKPKKDVEPKKVVETKKVIEKPVESDEIVPLPISMLKNQNFINIVAHTYLAGNPMLDEDAANLAAQYSTLKAFNEAQRTGKDVCSGPIYDIAVKVIGKDVLKKMRTLNDKADSATAEAASADAEMNKRLVASQEPVLTPGKSSQNSSSYARALRDDLINGKLGTNVEINEKEQPVDVPPTPIAGSMVSVGLIQRVNNNNSFDPHGGECILPDSQNMITNDISTSGTAAVQTLTAHNRLSYVDTKKPLILRQALLSKQLNEESKFPNTPITVRRIIPNITISTNSKLAFNKLNVPTSTPTKPTLAAVTNTTSDNTICLDSDEEDAVPPTPRPATITQVTSNTSTITPAQHKSTPNMQAQAMPVPVSLTMANAPGVTLPLATLQNLAPPVATSQPLIFKQVTGGNGLQSNFVLVPSDQLPLPLKLTTSTPVQATQPINSVLLPQSNLKTVIIEPSKLKPSPCKPGDILKITKFGSPVVQKQNDKKDKAQNNKVHDKKVAAAKLLNSIDLTDKPAPTSSKPATQKPSATVTINLTDEAYTTPPKASIGKEKKPKKPAHTSCDESTSSDASLSIFKDVIQIQASDYSEPSSEAESSKKSNIVQSEKTYNSPKLVQHVVSTDKYSTTIKLADGKKLTQVPNNKVPKHIDAAVRIKMEESKKKQTLFKSKEDDPKGISSNKKASFKTITVGNTPEKKGSSSKQSSTSFATATVDLTNQPVPYFSAVTMANTKRQSSTVDKTTIKRKKSAPMTLKDFDLDDIDDIIELE